MTTRGHHGLLLAPVGGGGGATHSYWKLSISAVQSGAYVSIAKIEFRATPGGADQAVGGTAFSSSDYNPSYVAANAFNGNPGDEWANGIGAPFPHEIGYHFPSPVAVGELAVLSTDAAYGGPNERPKDWAVLWSDDGVTYTVERTVTAQTGWGDSELRLYAVP